MRTCYLVTSPTWESGSSYLEPPEESVDIVFVWCRTKRNAIKAAVRHWQRGHKARWNGCCWPHVARHDDLNPYVGVRAEDVELLTDDREGRGGQDANPTPTAGTTEPRRSSG